MDRRVEPRLKTETAATLTVVRHSGVLETNCIIADVSSVGYRLLMQERLNPEETIQLKLDGARVLGRIQYCRPEDGKFSIGVERVDEWLVAPAVAAQRSFPSDADAHEPLQALGRPKIHALDRLTTIATRLLFARSAVHEERHSRKLTKTALAAGVVVAIALLGLYFHLVPVRLRGDSMAAKSTDAPQQANAVNPAAPQAQSGFDAKTPGNSSGSLETHQVLLKANDNGWVLACSDGRKLFEKLLKSGDMERFHFSKQALLHSGNAGALEVTLDSRPAAAMGEGSSVHAWRFSPDGYQDVPVALNHTCEIR